MKSSHQLPWVAAILLAGLVTVRASSPDLKNIMPRGGLRGTEVEFKLGGDRLKDAAEIMLYDSGVVVKEMKPAEDGKSIALKLALTPGATLGEHYLRVRTASGLSQVETFWVGQYPSVDEKEPNSLFTTPQAVALNSTVAGTVENEDVDYYTVEAKKGQRLSVEVEGIRLSGAFYDPYVAILNKDRFELAAADDTPLLVQDCYAQIIVPEDGTYTIQVRDSAYTGSGGCRYRLHVGSFPRPSMAYPAGGKIGTEVDVKLLGDKGGELTRKVKLPAESTDKFPLIVDVDGQFSPSPVWMRVSELENVLESEPNNEGTKATATALPLPLAFNGIIQEAKDEDWFKFTAKKDQKFTFLAHCKSIRSPLDPVIHILQAADGKYLAGNDDGQGPDSKMDWTAPADGDYWLKIHDHLLRGGPDFVYRVEATTAVPSLTLTTPEFARYDYQSRQTVPLAKGNRMAMVVNANRANFGADVLPECPDLPAGVKLLASPIPGNTGTYTVVWEAAPDAPLGGKLIDLIGRSADPKVPVVGHWRQVLNLMMGEPNNTPYYSSTVHKLAMAVVDEVPFKIDIDPPKVPLVHNGTMNLRVFVTRKEGFKAAVTVRMLWFPPNIGGQGTVAIPEGQNEVMYALNANGNAEVKTNKICVVGESDAGAGPILASSAMTDLAVAPPYLGMKIDLAALEQGKGGDVICKLDWTKPFEGKAKLILQGLPAKATAPELMIGKDDKEVHFAVTTAADTPVGQHKQLFCSLEIPEAGVSIPHNVGHGGVLRVDAPPPPPKNPAPAAAAPVAAAAPPPAAPPAGQPVKQLSRLEKLRLEAAGKK